jgi:hypothetical protein
MSTGTDSYQFCCGPDGGLARRRLLGHTGIAECGEIYVSTIGRWRLSAAAMSESDHPTISLAEATELAQAPEALRLHALTPPTLRHTMPAIATRDSIWLDEAISLTLREIRSEEQTVITELPAARPGSWDYDYEMDAIAWIKRAYLTLQSVLEERQTLETRQTMRDETGYDD